MNGYHHTLQFTKLVTLRRMISSSLGRLGIKKLFASFKETKEYFVWIDIIRQLVSVTLYWGVFEFTPKWTSYTHKVCR